MQKFLLALLLILFLLVSCKLKEDVTDPDGDTDTDTELAIEFPNGNDSLMVGANYDILWSSTIQSTLVLEYSTDNGSSWLTISDSVANTGSYTWGPLPNSKSARCLMRVRTANGSSIDESDSTWSIIENINKILILTSPTGGEIVQQGSSLDIEWISSKVTSVKIEFSVNNGNTWETIISNYDATSGNYTWENIPAVSSANCLIRISDLASSTVSDILSTPFTIVINENLLLITPNGGEEVEGGSEYEIKWYSKDIANVKLEYSINNGINWNTITGNLTNTGLYLWNTIPNTPSNLAKLRISDVDNPLNIDESDTTFSILPEANINIVSPASGEQWLSGTTQLIQWTSKNVANVRLEYSTNNGATWSLITSSVPSNGFYSWDIPGLNSNLCNIRISDASDGRPINIMENPFTIYTGDDVLEVYAPNGGESWEIGTDQEIKWFAFGVTSLKIEYTTNNGQSWQTVANSVANVGTYNWRDLPNTPSSLAKIKISDATTDSELSDESDGTFTISQESQIEVKDPNGGEQLQSGTTTNIQWTSTNVENIKIEYTTNSGASWTTIVENTPSIGFYAWENVPAINSKQCRIKISDASDGIPNDISDANFEISNQIVKSLNVKSPNGGEDWEAGTRQNITWSSSAVPTVKIELTTNQGASWSELVASITGGAFEWNINDELNSTQCQIRVSDINDPAVSDISDGIFTISPIKSLTVTAPTGPITFKDSDPITITWESSGIKTVGIKYTTTNGVGVFPEIPEFYDLVTKIANQGKFTTSFSVPSDQYYVVVYNADEGADGTPSARSIGNFKILKTEAPAISLLAPNGSEQWLVSKPNPIDSINSYHPYEIRWNSTGTEKVKLEWSTTGGGTWYTVPGADSTVSDGSFVWAPGHKDVVRPDSSDNCLIRVTSITGGTSDVSDNFFSIHESKKIRIVYPNDGEDFFKADTAVTYNDDWPLTITWTSYAVAKVDIYYSLDNGVTWESLTNDSINHSFPDGFQSTGAIAWDFVYGLLISDRNGTVAGPIDARTSTLGRIKIVDHSNNKVWDVNDIPFWLNVEK